MRPKIRYHAGRCRGARAAGAPGPAPPQTGNGWTILATLSHRPGRSTLVRLHQASIQLDVDAWARSDSWCEHCHVRRERRTTYLLRHLDGRLAQVGSTCLLAFAERHGRPKAQPEDKALARSSPALRPWGEIDTSAYLAQVAQAVSDAEFVRAGAGSETTVPTWVIAADALEQHGTPSARADRRAEDALGWVRDELAMRPELDDFEQRLVDTLREDRLLRRELPTAAAAIYAYHRHLRRVIAARKTAGGYIAAPGTSVTTLLTVLCVERVATPSGPVRRHHLTDELRRRAVWDSHAVELPIRARWCEVTVCAHQDSGHPVTVLEHCVAT